MELWPDLEQLLHGLMYMNPAVPTVASQFLWDGHCNTHYQVLHVAQTRHHWKTVPHQRGFQYIVCAENLREAGKNIRLSLSTYCSHSPLLPSKHSVLWVFKPHCTSCCLCMGQILAFLDMSQHGQFSFLDFYIVFELRLLRCSQQEPIFFTAQQCLTLSKRLSKSKLLVLNSALNLVCQQVYSENI